jgi:hypothetical protein
MGHGSGANVDLLLNQRVTVDLLGVLVVTPVVLEAIIGAALAVLDNSVG